MDIQRNHEDRIGPSELQYQATCAARRTTPVDFANLPQNETASQLRTVDRGLEDVDAHRNELIRRDADEWVIIDCLLHGVVVPFRFNIGQMRQHLGLPGFPLLPI